MMETTIKVLLVDDQQDLVDELRSLLQTDPQIQVVGTACDGFDALQKMQNNLPDVVLMDIRMPNMNGVVATERIKATYPDVKVVILTTFDDSDYILNAINHGASGYLLKDTSANKLINAVKNAYEGDTILPAQIARHIASAAKNVVADREIKLSRAFMLSDREIEIALMIYEGFTNRQISAALNISEGTTRNYVSSIYEKMECENREDTVRKMSEIL